MNLHLEDKMEKRKISDGNLIFRIAYGNRSAKNQPDKVSICGLVRRALFMFFIGWPGLTILAAALIIMLNSLAFMLSAKYLGWVPQEDDPCVKVVEGKPIPHWPKLFGHRIVPIWILVAGYLMFNLTTAIGGSSFPEVLWSVVVFIGATPAAYLSLVATAVILLIILMRKKIASAWKKACESETAMVLRDSWTAFKENVCWEYEVVKNPISDNSDK